MLITITSTNGVLFNDINIDDLNPKVRVFSVFTFLRFSTAKE